MSDTSTLPMADLAKLEKVLDREGAVEMCEMFLEDTTDILQKISSAIESRDCERIREVAHMLKGCCKSVSAVSIAEMCAEMEGAAREQDIRHAVDCLPKIANAYAALELQLRTYLKS